MPITRQLLLALLALAAAPASATQLVDTHGLEDLFHAHGVRGTVVLATRGAPTMLAHDAERAARRYLPASTFKIPNTLIGLASGAVAGVDEVLPYGGGKQFLPQWERDMALREAMPLSNVPVYQHLARRIGLQRMADGLRALDYGSMEIGDRVDRFWLDGPLAISALEQVRFLTRLAEGSLPLPLEVQQATREILRIDAGVDADGRPWTLYAKTGYARQEGAQDLGWWVGWVERGEAVHVFALNLDLEALSEAPKRIALGRAVLQRLGALPGG